MKLPSLHSDLPSADDYLPGHGDRSWSARHYDLELDYEVGANRLRGQAGIDVVALTDTDRLVLDLAHLEVGKLTVDGRSPAKYSQRGDRLVVRLREMLPAGQSCRLMVKYAGQPRPIIDRHLGEAGWEELDDGVLVAGQPHGAPSWFPCNDRPDDKASYRIVVTTEPEYTVVANGLLAERRQHGSSVSWEYLQDEPMATYLASVQIGHYEVLELHADPPVMVAIPPGSHPDFAAGLGRQPEMMRTFGELFGPYPFGAYTAVVTADVLEIPLEAQSLSTFGSNFVSADWNSVRLVAHELAHQWFGNAVTLGAWRDIWLHEGFACYAEWLWSEASGGLSADRHARDQHRRLAGLAQDLLLSDPGPDLMFDDRVYKRGALTLHALRLTLGDEAFFSVLRSWVAGNNGGTVTTEDFARHVGARSETDLAGLFDAWLNRTPLPDLPPAS